MTRILLCSLAGLPAAMYFATVALSQTPATVRVDGGESQGVVADGVASYKDIPFAAPPVGDLRWRPPQPVGRWTGRPSGCGIRRRLHAGTLRSASPRFPCPVGRLSLPERLASRERRANSENACDGLDLRGRVRWRLERLAQYHGNTVRETGVVLVAANYRLGRFGFVAFPALSREHADEVKGNYAYMDQIAALQWVKRNIAAFGGDPSNVTIFGFSEGGVSVHSLLASPMARGLFHKGIAESGGSRDSVLTARPMSKDGVDPNYPVSAETIGTNFARSMAIDSIDQAAMAKLRALGAEEVLRGAPAQSGAAVNLTRRRRFLTAN